MKGSSERILTTHVGSLARPAALLDVMKDKENGRTYDAEVFTALVRSAVSDVVRKQAESGLDVISDGEQGRVNFVTYVRERLTGFEPVGEGAAVSAGSWKLEAEAFPEYYADYFGKYGAAVATIVPIACRGPVRYVGQAALQRDIETLKDALREVDVAEAFMPATIPEGVARNEFYASEEEFDTAVGEALREEYRTIIEAGLVLQIDDPMLIELLNENPARDLATRRKAAQKHVEVLNHALRGLPAERIRLHVCYGLNHGPRVHDVAFREVVPFMLAVNAGAYSFEAANPRHMHEWRLWEEFKLPEGKLLIPGLLGHAISYVEHPELIADQITTYARLVGRDGVLAGADCGFSSRATYKPEVHPRIVWAKFAALAEGARIASRRLWGGFD